MAFHALRVKVGTRWLDPQPWVAPLSWTDVSVPALRGGHLGTASIAFTCAETCTVRVLCDDVSVTGHGADLFEALGSARHALEPQGIVLSVHGARRDVYPSPMQRQTVRGRRAYVLTVPRSRSRLPVVDIFGAATDISSLTSVDDQRAFFDSWCSSSTTSDGEGHLDP